MPIRPASSAIVPARCSVPPASGSSGLGGCVCWAGRSVPDRLVEYDGGPERIAQTRHGVGQINAAEPLVGETVAVCVDHDACGRDLVDIRPRPKPDGAEMAMRPVFSCSTGQTDATKSG